jgi:hypothetical protein
MARNKFIREKDVESIVHIIHNWSKGKISWEALCNACNPVLGYVPTRQGLNGHQTIKEAFQAKQSSGKKNTSTRKPLPSSLAVASERIARLNSTVATLQEETDRLRDRFVTWQYNAYKHGLTREQLDEPLPFIDRERNTT